ncbi:type VII secretion-associated protein [Nocardia sp. NPDC049190]|uniref:type VII secretion-associated protein n=1 Tax=Nocardia sp. NPDC049190 TaxID=3155650 RepID=UPI0033F32A41
MSEIELVITETRIWARGATTHWDVPPSIMLGSNGFDLVVGPSLTPPTQVGSAVQFIPADAIALPPRTPSVVDAMGAVFANVLENLGVAAPCGRITLICPTEWGSTRRTVLDQAARRFASDVGYEDIAVRAVTADGGADHSPRTLVVECNSLSTTAATVVRSHRGVHVESCEHEPALALAEITPESRAMAQLCALLDRLLDGEPVGLAQVTGTSDPAKLDLLRAALEQTCGDAVEMRSVAGPDLLRGHPAEARRQREASSTLPNTEWMQRWRDRAAAQREGHRISVPVLVMVAAVVVVALVVVGATAMLNRGDDTASAAPPTTMDSTGRDLPPEKAPGSETVGRIRFAVPPGWRLGTVPENPGGRVDLVPGDGTRQRITVMQTPIAADAGNVQVAAQLELQIAQRPPGVLTDLRRDVVFGGRSGLAYSERPGDGSTVRWHVVLEHGIQVSIGCQSVGESWSHLETVCERFGDSVRVVA